MRAEGGVRPGVDRGPLIELVLSAGSLYDAELDVRLWKAGGRGGSFMEDEAGGVGDLASASAGAVVVVAPWRWAPVWRASCPLLL